MKVDNLEISAAILEIFHLEFVNSEKMSEKSIEAIDGTTLVIYNDL